MACLMNQVPDVEEDLLRRHPACAQNAGALANCVMENGLPANRTTEFDRIAESPKQAAGTAVARVGIGPIREAPHDRTTRVEAGR